jgi:aminoglycoside phosphotransferase (APT) family kinase protein
VTEPGSDTRPVSAAHAFDPLALQRYLESALAGFSGPVEVRQFSNGQSNPTYLISARSGRYVLRRKPPGALLPSAHAVDREFRIMSALRATDVAVPEMLCYCADAGVVGTPFYVMSHVEGRIFRTPDLPGLEPEERRKVYDEVNRVTAALHAVDAEKIGLGDLGRSGNYLERQVARWTTQYRSTQTESIEAMDRLIEWLPSNVPGDSAHGIAHGDLRVDNMIFATDEPRLLAVLDWELATLGDPLADLGYQCMAWRLPAPVPYSIGGLDLARLGIPRESEYVARYCARTGRPSVANLDFYVAFSMFRMAAILQGVTARALQGNASSARAMEMGRFARPYAEAAWEQARQSSRTY